MTVFGFAVDVDKLRDICDRYGVARLDVFGSTARDDARSDSDIDVLYELAPGARLGGRLRIWLTSCRRCLDDALIWCRDARCTSVCATKF